MLKEKEIRQLAENILKDSDLFLVDVSVGKDNYIRIFIDSHEGVNIESCARINRMIEAQLNRNKEDFELEVSSPGLDAPFKVFRQYLKNINKEVYVTGKDGIKHNGKLIHVDHDGISLEINETIKKSGGKRNVNISKYILFSEIKSTRVKINI